MTDVERTVFEILRNTSQQPDLNITRSTKIESLQLDSVDNLEVIMKLEEFFGIDFDTAKITRLVSVGDLINLVDETQSETK